MLVRKRSSAATAVTAVSATVSAQHLASVSHIPTSATAVTAVHVAAHRSYVASTIPIDLSSRRTLPVVRAFPPNALAASFRLASSFQRRCSSTSAASAENKMDVDTSQGNTELSSGDGKSRNQNNTRTEGRAEPCDAAEAVSGKEKTTHAMHSSHSVFNSQEVPPAVYQRINGNRQELLRLLRAATHDGTAGVPAARLAAAFRTHLNLNALAQQQLSALADAVATSANPASQTTTAEAASRPAVPATWLAAMWDAVAPHCIFYQSSTPPNESTRTRGNGGHSNNVRAGPSDRSGESSAKRGAEPTVFVLPFDWTAAVDQLAAYLPYEGWSEREVMAHLCLHHRVLDAHPPLWRRTYNQSTSLAQFLHRRFGAVLLLTRSAVTQEAIVHRAGRNSVSVSWRGLVHPNNNNNGDRSSAVSSSPYARGATSAGHRSSVACTSLQHALHTIGRGHQLPVWTDADALAPLLTSTPSALSATASPAAWKEAWMRDGELRACFHLDGYVRVRAAATAAQDVVVVVDLISLGAAHQKEDSSDNRKGSGAFVPLPVVLRLLQDEVHAAPNSRLFKNCTVSVKVLTRSQTTATEVAQVEQAIHAAIENRQGTDGTPVVLFDRVVVDALLEPQHVLGALLDAEVARRKTAARSNTTVMETFSGAVRGGTAESRAEVENENQVKVFLLCGETARSVFEEILRDVSPSSVDVTMLTPFKG